MRLNADALIREDGICVPARDSVCSLSSFFDRPFAKRHELTTRPHIGGRHGDPRHLADVRRFGQLRSIRPIVLLLRTVNQPQQSRMSDCHLSGHRREQSSVKDLGIS